MSCLGVGLVVYLVIKQAIATRERARGLKLEDDLRRTLLRNLSQIGLESMQIFSDNRLGDTGLDRDYEADSVHPSETEDSQAQETATIAAAPPAVSHLNSRSNSTNRSADMYPRGASQVPQPSR